MKVVNIVIGIEKCIIYLFKNSSMVVHYFGNEIDIFRIFMEHSSVINKNKGLRGIF